MFCSPYWKHSNLRLLGALWSNIPCEFLFDEYCLYFMDGWMDGWMDGGLAMEEFRLERGSNSVR